MKFSKFIINLKTHALVLTVKQQIIQKKVLKMPVLKRLIVIKKGY